MPQELTFFALISRNRRTNKIKTSLGIAVQPKKLRAHTQLLEKNNSQDTNEPRI